MNDNAAAVSTRTVDAVVAAIMVAVGGVVMWDSARVGASWADDGPQAGYFPFYVGGIILISSLANLVIALAGKGPGGTFVERGQLVSVLKVLIPAILFVAAIGWLGIYVSAALYIAIFMAWLGKYKPWIIAPVAIGVPIVLFFLFDIWFLVPLPKGPLEAALGY
jgi:putative tricarboxylic transport membrane protein